MNFCHGYIVEAKNNVSYLENEEEVTINLFAKDEEEALSKARKFVKRDIYNVIHVTEGS